MLTGIAIFKDHAVVGITPWIWSGVSARCTPHTAATGLVFSGQNICRAQSQNCETENKPARPARETGGDSGEVEVSYESLNRERCEK
jgi:hypothetical protein